MEILIGFAAAAGMLVVVLMPVVLVQRVCISDLRVDLKLGEDNRLRAAEALGKVGELEERINELEAERDRLTAFLTRVVNEGDNLLEGD